MDPAEIADQMGDRRVTPDLINLLKTAISEQIPEAQIVGSQADSFRVFHGRRSLEVRETLDDRVSISGIMGTVGVYDDAYQALGGIVDFFTQPRQPRSS